MGLLTLTQRSLSLPKLTQRLKPIMSKIVSKEKLRFLFNRHIHDAVSLAQDAIHSINKNKGKAFVLKLDLSKAYDRVSWTFLRLLLLQIGVTVDTINQIMGCIHFSSFAVLINGYPSSFSRPSIGFRKGYPLLAFLFLLIADALSRIILHAKHLGSYTGIKVSENEELYHILLVDDVLMMGEGSIENIRETEQILKLYKKAIGIYINVEKYILFENYFLEMVKNMLVA